MKVFPDGEQICAHSRDHCRETGVTINRPLVGAEGKSISHKNHLMEEFELWHFLQAQ